MNWSMGISKAEHLSVIEIIVLVVSTDHIWQMCLPVYFLWDRNFYKQITITNSHNHKTAHKLKFLFKIKKNESISIGLLSL